jgi:hypothetical protein
MENIKKFLNKIREPDKSDSLKKKILFSSIIFIGGILLGLMSKLLDLNTFNSKFINALDLGNFFSNMSIWLLLALAISVYSKTPIRSAINVFLFFFGVCISYHLSTIMFANFNPQNYMMIWYIITFISPVLAFICWYSVGNGYIPVIICSFIFYVMFSFCFGIGIFYFDYKGPLYFLSFLFTVIVLYKNPKRLLISLLIGLILAIFIRYPFVD